jgi:hypothetical protein
VARLDLLGQNGTRSKPSIITPLSSFIVKSIGPTMWSRPRATSHCRAASSSGGSTSGSSSSSRKPNIPQRLPWWALNASS